MEKILNFLKENHTFYFATVDGDKPKVRPFGFCMEHNGKLYFGMGKQKKSFEQVMANPILKFAPQTPREYGSESAVWLCLTTVPKLWLKHLK